MQARSGPGCGCTKRKVHRLASERSDLMNVFLCGQTPTYLLLLHLYAVPDVFTAGAASALFSAPPDDGDADTDYGDSDPPVTVDAFTQEGFRSKGSRGIAQGTDRHHETHFLE